MAFENDHGIDLSEMNGNGFCFTEDTFDHEIDFFEMNENLDDFLNTHISMRLVKDLDENLIFHRLHRQKVNINKSE